MKHVCADLSADGTVLVVGLPDPGYGGRSVRVFLADQNGTFIERLNVTAPNNGPGGSRFGAQVLLQPFKSAHAQLGVLRRPSLSSVSCLVFHWGNRMVYGAVRL